MTTQSKKGRSPPWRDVAKARGGPSAGECVPGRWPSAAVACAPLAPRGEEAPARPGGLGSAALAPSAEGPREARAGWDSGSAMPRGTLTRGSSGGEHGVPADGFKLPKRQGRVLYVKNPERLAHGF